MKNAENAKMEKKSVRGLFSSAPRQQFADFAKLNWFTTIAKQIPFTVQQHRLRSGGVR